MINGGAFQLSSLFVANWYSFNGKFEFKAANSWGLTRAHNIDVLCQQLPGCIIILMKVLNVKSNLHVWRRCRKGYKSTEFQSQLLQAKQEHAHTLLTSSAAWHLANEVFGFACGITVMIANGSASVTTGLITPPEFKLFWTHNLRKGAEVKRLIKSGHDFDLLDNFMSPIVESLRYGHSGAKMPGKKQQPQLLWKVQASRTVLTTWKTDHFNQSM